MRVDMIPEGIRTAKHGAFVLMRQAGDIGSVNEPDALDQAVFGFLGRETTA